VPFILQPARAGDILRFCGFFQKLYHEREIGARGKRIDVGNELADAAWAISAADGTIDSPILLITLSIGNCPGF
jgi:hypothetical protein